jgi:ribonuclease P protein component
MPKRLAFPKSSRLASNRQFKAVLDGGRRAGDGLLTLYAAPNDAGRPRLGISVGRSSGKAVVRNRLKRLVREAFRRNQHGVPQSFDYLVMISPSFSRRLRRSQEGAKALASLTFERVQRSFLSLVQTALRAEPHDDQPNRPHNETSR